MALTDDDKAWITEAMRQMETHLLTAFQKWASPMEDINESLERYEARAGRLRADRIADLVRRIEALEKQLPQIPPSGQSP